MSQDGMAHSTHAMVTGRLAWTRFVVGLAQGGLLYWLYHAAQSPIWPATERYLFAPLVMTSLFMPVLIVSSLGHLPRRLFWRWMIAATALVAALAAYNLWRTAPQGTDLLASHPALMLGTLLFFVLSFALFIAQSLVLSSAADQRLIARYPTYFESAWKLAVQIKFSALFVGVLWLVLWLGASLFELIKLSFLKELLTQPWFSIPATAFAFSSAMHITDVRPNIVRGIRTLLLVLISWLLPLTTLIVAGFLASLPATGLAPLWATRHATAVLLGAAAVLVLMVNAAYQDGEHSTAVARVLRASARVAAGLLLPIVGIAVYALSLRVRQYGWSIDRVFAAASLVVAACYAVGYGWATLRRDGWLRRVAPVNIATAFVVLILLIAIVSPVLDPARIAVASQVARLNSGRVSVSAFDFDYLRFNGERFGAEALRALKANAKGADAAALREKVDSTLAKRFRWDPVNSPVKEKNIVSNLAIWPRGQSLPDSFIAQLKTPGNTLSYAVPCLQFHGQMCNVYVIDLSGDGIPELLFVPTQGYAAAALMRACAEHKWEVVGHLDMATTLCAQDMHESLATGQYRLIAPELKDIEINGKRLLVTPAQTVRASCR